MDTNIIFFFFLNIFLNIFENSSNEIRFKKNSNIYKKKEFINEKKIVNNRKNEVRILFFSSLI